MRTCHRGFLAFLVPVLTQGKRINMAYQDLRVFFRFFVAGIDDLKWAFQNK